ncbi:uncharacterized protein LOC128180166 [Crassostrea angulata]|uniref:uncharacterized protein LOC128180166 n=1 Tax=Magallana angulata TaxID=2784310 RepID=UPI0022B0D62B|nr:uncharacterized protein LOC128180166 [Crassostrea angulata]
MSLYTNACLVILGYFFSSIIVLNTCKKLEGYKFPVHSTKFCPGNESEWNKRASALNCNKTNGYTCLPNENFTELLEFCYTAPFIWIQEGVCLYLKRRGSYVDAYNCSHFIDGCHNTSYQSSRIFDYPACITIGDGCLLAEQFCKSSPNTTHHPETSELDTDDWLWVLIVISIVVVCFSSCMLYVYRKRKFSSCKRGNDIKNTSIELEELNVLIADTEDVKNDISTEQSTIEKAIFSQWKQDDFFFISTKACKDVEKNIKNRNLVIVTGHSGSGKSAIIHHIALKYRVQGWVVKRLKKVEDIVDIYSSSRFQKYKTICVFNDPFGKESFDELLNKPWQTYEEELKLYLKTAKLIMSCRNHIISETRLTRFNVYQSHIVDIDDNKNKLTVEEKRQILRTYKIDKNLSDEDCDKIVEVETYFPLLCKLYSNKEDNGKKNIKFFTEPVTVLTEEILGFRAKDRTKYCALALLVLFNNDICVSDLLKDSDTENKFNHTLKLCGLPENTPPLAIRDSLNSLKGCFVKSIGDKYQFNHDFVMEVTTQVFGTDYPAEIIRYAETGFLRRRVRLGDCEKHNDSFSIYLSERYIEELGERLLNELFEEHFLDVVLSPCLRNEKVIELLKKKIAANPENIRMFLKRKKVTIDKQEVDDTSKNLLLTKLSFLDLEKEVSPLIALIVFCHTHLSQYCLNILQQMNSSSKRNFFAWVVTKLFRKPPKLDDVTCYFSAMCCNGSTELINSVFKDPTKKLFARPWKVLFPIHIVALFHNYHLLFDMIKNDEDVNLKTIGKGGWTPLILAAGNDTQDYGHCKHEESGEERRDKTVRLLLIKGAEINLCNENGASPLLIACQNGHDSTVQLLLSKGAAINLCLKDGASPLFIACQNGHDRIVQLLLSKGADINLCMEDGASPLFIACQNGHDSMVQLLLSNRADINLCMENGASPLFIACQNGHDSTVQLLLSNRADINLCKKNGASPLFIACQNGHDSIEQLLLSNNADINLCMEDGACPLFITCQNGHDSMVQLLLSKGADVNLCNEIGASPLFIACQNGHDSTVQLLLSNRVDINLCMEDGASPLFTACQNGHDSTVQLLLSKGADINLCMENKASPLYIACQNGQDSTVQLLLSKEANINLCMADGTSPLFIACQNGQDNTVQLLLSRGADINLCRKDGTSPLFIACQNGHDSTVQLLLSNRANINLCKKNGSSSLFIACQNGHNSTVQLLLSNRADINLCKKNGASSLYIACQNGHDSTVQLLLNEGADINLCMEDGASPLLIACQNGHDSTVQLLLSGGADINSCMEDGASSLFKSCQNGHDSTVQLLLSKGADINLCTEDGASPLFIACLNGHDTTVQLLLSRGADINLCMEAGASPLFIACQNGHDSTVQLLLSNRADINLCMEDGASPLFIACQNGHNSTVQLLLSNRADINLCMEDGTSPLFVACQNGHNCTVQLLLSKGADINLCREDGVSPLRIACECGHDATVQLLLDHGADINLCNKDGVSPLYIAFAWRQYKTVNTLLKRNADTRLSSGLNPTYLDLVDKNDSTMVFLQRKDNIYNNIYDPDSYFSLFVFSHVEQMSRALFFIHFYNS